MTETIIVIDFETTGLSPAKGARATEIAAVKLLGDQIVDSFQSLMNAGVPVPPIIQQKTGITNDMLRHAPPCGQVMARLRAFVGEHPLVAHNARFDEGFLLAEYRLAGIAHRPRFACTLELARCVYPRAPNHKLATLLEYADIPHEGTLHRALADATATAKLLVQMRQDLCARHRLKRPSHAQLCKLASTPPGQVAQLLERWR